MGLFSKGNIKDNTNASLHSTMNDLRSQQQDMVEKLNKDRCDTEQRVSDVLSDLETYMAKLDNIVHRLDNITGALVLQQGDESLKPWYVRIFCP